MGDAAQGEPQKHVVFEKPIAVHPTFEESRTPANYRHYPGGDKLPATLKTWRIQETGKPFGGVVSDCYGFDDSPDAEILTPGFNEGKGPGDAGVSRHGNFLQWGYSAPPSQMTPAGQAFFVNAICYIHGFDGFGPLVKGRGAHRAETLCLALWIKQMPDKTYLQKFFGKDLYTRFANDPQGLLKYFKDDYELICKGDRDQFYRIDTELKALGLASNRRLGTLDRLVALLKDKTNTPAARKLLARYTEQAFATPAEWEAWLKASRARIYFSDWGGYKFRVAPPDYPVVPGRVGVEIPPDDAAKMVLAH